MVDEPGPGGKWFMVDESNPWGKPSESSAKFDGGRMLLGVLAWNGNEMTVAAGKCDARSRGEV